MPFCSAGCGAVVSTEGAKCPRCLFGPKTNVRPTVQRPPVVTQTYVPPMPTRHVVQPVVVPVPVYDPNTLPVGANLQVKCRRAGELNFTVLNPGNLLYILQDTQIEFRATQQGGSQQQALLTNFGTTVWSGTSGASGTGASKTVRFGAVSNANGLPGAYTVTLAFSGQAVTINCLVYSLNHTLTPADAFANRSMTSFGVDERLTLVATLLPMGVTATDVGGLTWSVASSGRTNDGLMHNPATHAAPVLNDGRAEYIAPCRTHDGTQLSQKTKAVQLRLRVAAGLCAGLGKTIDITICQPSAHMRKAPGTNERHTNGVPSAGFYGQIFFTPKDVSFSTLRFREGTGAIRTYGFGNDAEDGVTQHNVTAIDISISTGDINRGCIALDTGGVAVEDNVFSGEVNGFVVPKPAYDVEVGKESWPIKWEYTYPDLVTGNWTNPWISMQLAHHVATLYQTGRMTMFKGHTKCAEGLCNAKVSKNMNDPTVV